MERLHGGLALIALVALFVLSGCEAEDDFGSIPTSDIAVEGPGLVFGSQPFPVKISKLSPGETVRLHVFSRTSRPGRLSHSVTEYVSPQSGVLNTAAHAPVSYSTPSIRRIFWRRTMINAREAPLARIRERIDWPSSHWLIAAETPERVGWTLVEVAPARTHPELVVEPLEASGMEGWRFAPASEPGPLMILIGGADGFQTFAMAQALAQRGVTAVTLDWRSAMAPSRCLGRLDFDVLDAAVDAVIAQTGIAGGAFGLFGFSHGQVLALLYVAHGRHEPGFVATASGSDVVGHGEGGPLCLFPDTGVRIGGDPAAQINWWGPGPLALWRFTATRFGWMSQAEANKAALERTSPARVAAARLDAPPASTAFLAAAGLRDSLVPAPSAANRLCRIDEECLIFPYAEHELLWTGVSPLGCGWMGEETCEATGLAQDFLLEAIVERAYASLGGPDGFMVPFAPGQAPASPPH